MTDEPIKFVRASQAGIERHEATVARILEALGHPEAFVTDESLIGDFLDVTGRERKVRRRGGEWKTVPADPEARAANEAMLRKLDDAFGVLVLPSDRILELAHRLATVGKS